MLTPFGRAARPLRLVVPRVPDALTLLSDFVPDSDPQGRASHRRTIQLLRTTDAPFSRDQFAPGHLTASAVVLDATDAVLIIWHERLQRWLQPGGHFEAGDPDPLGAARREVREETGVDLSNVSGVLAGVDVHQIPAARGEPAHWHHDLVFAFRIAASSPTAMGEGRTAWCRVDELPAVGADAALRRAVARARLWGLSPG